MIQWPDGSISREELWKWSRGLRGWWEVYLQDSSLPICFQLQLSVGCYLWRSELNGTIIGIGPFVPYELVHWGYLPSGAILAILGPWANVRDGPPDSLPPHRWQSKGWLLHHSRWVTVCYLSHTWGMYGGRSLLIFFPPFLCGAEIQPAHWLRPPFAEKTWFCMVEKKYTVGKSSGRDPICFSKNHRVN